VRSDPPRPPHVSHSSAVTRGGISHSAPRRPPRVREPSRSATRKKDSWSQAIESDGGIRDGEWVARPPQLVEMSGLAGPEPVILRKERPPPERRSCGSHSDGLRITAFIPNTRPCGPRSTRGLEIAPPAARVEDRIRQPRPRVGHLPCHRTTRTRPWLEIILAETDLVAWTKTDRLHRTPRPWPRVRFETFPLQGACTVAARVNGARGQIRLG